MTAKRPKLFVDFVGYSIMSETLGHAEANIVLSPGYDVKAVVSSHIVEDGSRVITLVLRPIEPKLGRKGYSLKEEWSQETQINHAQPTKTV